MRKLLQSLVTPWRGEAHNRSPIGLAFDALLAVANLALLIYAVVIAYGR